MEEQEFLSQLQHAQLMCDQAQSLDAALYWLGFRWGFCRAFHGENFGIAEQHAWRSQLIDDPNPLKAAIGRGYADGQRKNAR